MQQGLCIKVGIVIDGQISCLLIVIFVSFDYSGCIPSSLLPSLLSSLPPHVLHLSFPFFLPSSVLLSFVYICVYLFIARLANHETKEDEEVAREQPVMARPVM